MGQMPHHSMVLKDALSAGQCVLVFLCKNMQFTGQKAELPASTAIVYWPENVIDWLGKWWPTCVMRHARGQKLQNF